MSSQWRFRLLNQEFGPVQRDELVQMVHSGQLALHDRVRQEGSDLWVPLRAIVGGSDSADSTDRTDPHGSCTAADAAAVALAEGFDESDEAPASETYLSGPRRRLWRRGATALACLIVIAGGAVWWEARDSAPSAVPSVERMHPTVRHKYAAAAAEPSASLFADWNVVERALVIFDGLVVVGAAVWFVRRRVAPR
ncbi:MAG TPA: GYF domain-containing protein [Planctomycetaceae bacterium]|nr:GYF domain-containing protein [Planctomycetaceae bacterium]